jgi:hypothetical protein
VLCLEGAIPPPTQPPRLVRAYTADDVIGPDGQLGYRVFLAAHAAHAADVEVMG